MKRMTQSYRLYRLLARKKAVTTEEIAKAIRRPTTQASGYVAELARVYGARIIYDTRSHRYVLRNRVRVPIKGVQGLRWKSASHKYQSIPHLKLKSKTENIAIE